MQGLQVTMACLHNVMLLLCLCNLLYWRVFLVELYRGWHYLSNVSVSSSWTRYYMKDLKILCQAPLPSHLPSMATWQHACDSPRPTPSFLHAKWGNVFSPNPMWYRHNWSCDFQYNFPSLDKSDASRCNSEVIDYKCLQKWTQAFSSCISFLQYAWSKDWG